MTDNPAASTPPARSTPTPPTDGFAQLGLDEGILATLVELGYEEPTPIQRAAVPPLLSGKDLLAEAPTGTGKTAAFALPMLQRLSSTRAADGRRASGRPAALVLATRVVPIERLFPLLHWPHFVFVRALRSAPRYKPFDPDHP